MPSLRHRIARWIAGSGKAPQRRMYASAKSTRTTGGFGSSGNSSADAEILGSLTSLRARSRQMVRDSSYAKRARTVVINNVIGSGIGMQAQVMTTRTELNKRVNDGIETAWDEWSCADSCHTGGRLHFHDLERAALGQVFEAGEVFIRLHRRKFGDSNVPLALELIEPERVGHEMIDPGAMSADADVRMGVEVDSFHRPVAYWIRSFHPGDVRQRAHQVDRYERVPASDIMHLALINRWPQTRGEPWMHTVLRKLDEMNEYTGLEVQAARGSASYFATITTPEEPGGTATAEEANGAKVMDLEPLTVQELAPGEELQFHAPNRPNSALDGFIRAMLREVASGLGVSYEALSRDYSQSNYSSSRLSLLDDRDTWRTLQQWWIRSFRAELHEEWLSQAVLARAIPSIPVEQYAIDPAKFSAVRWKPRGWQWVDPAKEVAAYKEARKAGFLSTSDVIAQTAGGADVEDVIADIVREDALFEAADIVRDTDVIEPAEQTTLAAPPATAVVAEDPEDAPAQSGRVVSFAR